VSALPQKLPRLAWGWVFNMLLLISIKAAGQCARILARTMIFAVSSER
jgi:hypothetical protein